MRYLHSEKRLLSFFQGKKSANKFVGITTAHIFLSYWFGKWKCWEKRMLILQNARTDWYNSSNNKHRRLFSPTDFGNIEMLRKVVKMTIEFFYSLFVSHWSLLHDTFFLLKNK